ncbi:MAG: aldose epimerase family protein [Ruthenibacterium sp.]
MGITSTFYGRTQGGRDVYQYTLTNTNNMRVCVIEYGCAITNLFVKDKTGKEQDVVLGYNTLAEYEQGTASLGSFVGRYANRIENACFTLDGKTYALKANDGVNHLHGTFGRMVYQGRVEGDSLVLSAQSPDGDDGFPGCMDITVTYTLTEENGLVLDYTASTTAPTLVNLTNHSYFNLNGRDSASMLDNLLRIDAASFTEGNEQTCPTGRILPVEGTPFDFRTAKPIGQDIRKKDAQLKMAHGYDHNFILTKEVGMLAKGAAAYSPNTGVGMTMYTTQPGVQLYTGNFLPGAGRQFAKYQGFCLETQHYPCTPSHPEFPPVTLRPGDEYHETTIYQFFAR